MQSAVPLLPAALAPMLSLGKGCWNDHRCAWEEGGVICGLRNGDMDPVGGGTVKLTPDHCTPHVLHAEADPGDPKKWQPLCGRHQVMKKNYWDDETGWLNVMAIVQSASEIEKRQVFEFLKTYFEETELT